LMGWKWLAGLQVGSRVGMPFGGSAARRMCGESVA
jgi:hypothetical protein